MERELLDRWNDHERALADTDSAEVPHHPAVEDAERGSYDANSR